MRRGRTVRWLQHAFAIEPSGEGHATEDQRPVVDRLCKEVVRRRLTAAALLYLETARPLNYLGSQALHFFQPIVSALFDTHAYEQFAKFLEHRGSVNYLCGRLEHLEAEYRRQEKIRRRGSAEDGVVRNRHDKRSMNGNTREL